MRQEFMERRIEKTDRSRASCELLKHADEVFPLIRKDFRESLLTVFLSVCKNHLAHRVDAIPFKEHVFSTAKPDATGPERDGVCSLLRGIGVGADIHAGSFGTPVHELLEVLIGLALCRLKRFLDKHLNDF